MQRFRLSIVVAAGLVVLLAIGMLASAGGTSTRAEDAPPLLQMPEFPPTPTIPPAPQSQPIPQSSVVLFSDSFDSKASLANWRIVDVQAALPGEESVWRIAEGHLLQDRTALAYDPSFRDTMAVTGETSWSDYTITTKVYDAANATFGLVARQQGGSFYRFRLFSEATDGDRKLVLEKVVDGVATELASAGGAGYQRYRWYTIALTVSGSQLTATIDGAPALQATDTTLTSGQAGVTTIAFGAVSFDDVTVTAP